MTEMGIVSTGTWFPETYVTAAEIAEQSGLPEWVVREVPTSSEYVTRPITEKGLTRRLYAATRAEDAARPFMAHLLKLARTVPVRMQRAGEKA